MIARGTGLLPSFVAIGGRAIAGYYSAHLKSEYSRYAGDAPLKGQFRLQTDPDRHNIQKPLPLTNDEGPRAYYIVTPDGLEPSTLRLEVTCSIQLSYGAKLV